MLLCQQFSLLCAPVTIIFNRETEAQTYLAAKLLRVYTKISLSSIASYRSFVTTLKTSV
ncbi:hypothetical protein STEG23_017813, partial [Scotinomys teguina]